MVFGEGTGDPELKVSQVSQIPPAFFVLHIWGLEASQQQSLFAEADKMLDVKALVVSGMDVQQAKGAAFLSDNEQPERV